MFIGLNKDVRFREDLGFSFLDDGNKIYKIESETFNQIMSQQPSPQIVRVAKSLPTIFYFASNRDEALNSYLSKQI